MGITLEEYNEMTPRELNLIINEKVEMMRREEEEKITIAFITAWFSRVEKLGPRLLKEILEKSKPKEPLSDEQLLTQIKAINAAIGGEIKRKTEEQE